MIKFSALKRDGGAVIGFGIDGENMARLMADEPILIRYQQILELLPEGVTLGVDPIEIVIIAGRDIEDLHTQIKPLIGPGTKLVGHGPNETGGIRP